MFGMFIGSQPIRCEMKLQKVDAKMLNYISEFVVFFYLVYQQSIDMNSMFNVDKGFIKQTGSHIARLYYVSI